MSPTVTSKQEILKKSRELLQQQGWSAVTIRSVAAACRVSVGSLYNYFDSKEALMAATVESIWCDIFHGAEDVATFQDTLACIAWLYSRMEYGCTAYPGFLTLHSIAFLQQDKADGKQRMQQIWQHMVAGFCSVLSHDPRIRPDAFTPLCTAEAFADLLFSLLLAAFLRQDYDPAPTLELVRRALY